MARRTPEQAEQTRQQLLQTALQQFSEAGIANVSLNRIATAAGVTRGAIYWHFKDKADLLKSMSEREFPTASAFAQIAAAVDNGTNHPLDALADLCIDFLRSLADNPALQQVCRLRQQAVFDSTLTERWQAIRAEEELRVERLMEQARKQEQLKGSLTPTLATQLLAGAMQGIVDRALLGNSDIDLGADAETIVQTVFAGLYPR